MLIDFTNLYFLNSFKKNDKKMLEHFYNLKLELVCSSKVHPDSSKFCVWD